MKILELPEYQQDYEIDTIHYDSDLESLLVEANPSVIFINGQGVNSYSGKSPLCPNFDWFSKFYINRSAMYNVINEVKLKKTAEEVALMRNSAEIGCNAHVFVMKNTKPGMTEAHVQTLFRVRNYFLKILLVVPIQILRLCRLQSLCRNMRSRKKRSSAALSRQRRTT
jgi:Xaa-Pro aminopeptidase